MFKKRLEAKYGECLLRDFDDLFTRQFWNLADIARRHRFSRERARQMFTNLYGHGYRQTRSKKTAERRQRQDLCIINFPPRLEPLLLELEREELPIKKAPNGRFDINGHIVRFYRASAVDYSGYGGKHFRVVFWNDAFGLGIVEGDGRFYVIPKSEFTFEQALQRLVLYIRATPYRGNNKHRCGTRPRDIEKYRDAWHLLKT